MQCRYRMIEDYFRASNSSKFGDSTFLLNLKELRSLGWNNTYRLPFVETPMFPFSFAVCKPDFDSMNAKTVLFARYHTHESLLYNLEVVLLAILPRKATRTWQLLYVIDANVEI